MIQFINTKDFNRYKNIRKQSLIKVYCKPEMNTIRKIIFNPQFARSNSSLPTEFVNRNPRNLERMRIARKPDGYHLEKPGRQYWHKLVLVQSQRTVTAQVVHFLNGTVLQAKSSEWPLRKRLYSVRDTCAYINLGKIFAQRCLESGITEMYCDIQTKEGGKVEQFLNELIKGGVKLQEPQVYKKPNPWDQFRPEKPWDVMED